MKKERSWVEWIKSDCFMKIIKYYMIMLWQSFFE